MILWPSRSGHQSCRVAASYEGLRTNFDLRNMCFVGCLCWNIVVISMEKCGKVWKMPIRTLPRHFPEKHGEKNDRMVATRISDRLAEDLQARSWKTERNRVAVDPKWWWLEMLFNDVYIMCVNPKKWCTSASLQKKSQRILSKRKWGVFLGQTHYEESAEAQH